MELADRTRLISVTSSFNWLQGLVYAPVALMNAAYPAIDMIWHKGVSRDLAKLGLFLCVVVGFFVARRYYRRRFGVVRATFPTGLKRYFCGLAIIATPFLMFAADGLDAWGPYYLSMTCLSWAIFYLGCYLVPFRLRSYSLWFAVLCTALCFLTQTGTIPKEEFFLGRSTLGLVFVWLAFAVHGLLDHLLLERLLPRRSGEIVPVQSVEQHG